MKQTIEKTWKLIDSAVTKYQKDYPGILCDNTAKDKFNRIFRELHKEIKEQYMSPQVTDLDRHKVASILILSIIQSEAIKYNGSLEKDQTFIGHYMIASSVAFSFMLDQLNRLLSDNDIQPVTTYQFPRPISCNTKYFDIFCRNLYYADKNPKWGLNPLDLAEKLFLLEYITLLENNIDPQRIRNDN